MQLGLSYIGVNCFGIFEVSNNGGKYGGRTSTLNTGCKPRKGGELRSKALLPTTLVIVKAHIEVGRASDGAS